VNFRAVYEKFVTRSFSSSSLFAPVKIAVLDTGTDTDHCSLQAYEDQIKARYNWTDIGPIDDVMDQLGHGTHIAGLILQYCPHAELYIAKIVDKGPLDPGVMAKVSNRHQCICSMFRVSNGIRRQSTMPSRSGVSTLYPFHPGSQHAKFRDTLSYRLQLKLRIPQRHLFLRLLPMEGLTPIAHILHGMQASSAYTPQMLSEMVLSSIQQLKEIFPTLRQ
jgi:subtilisin family serine protease